MLSYRCDNCKKEINIEDKRKVVIYEQLRKKHDMGDYGHYRIELCLSCLKKIGYKTINERKKPNKEVHDR